MLLSYGTFRHSHPATLSVGVLVAFFQYGLRFFSPIQDLSEKYNILQSAMAASERVFKLLDTAPQIASPVNSRPFPEGPAAIEFDRVWFAYKAEDWVLRDVSFRVESGETVAVVGHTGRGQDNADQSVCCASTTYSEAPSASAATIFASSNCRICDGISEWFCRIRTCSRER